jgi:hypothetical protein
MVYGRGKVNGDIVWVGGWCGIGILLRFSNGNTFIMRYFRIIVR